MSNKVYGSVLPTEGPAALSKFDNGIPDEEKQADSYQSSATVHEELEEISTGNSISKRSWLSVSGILILATVIALLGVAGYSNYKGFTSTAKLESSKTRFNIYTESADGIIQITEKSDLNIYATNEYGHFEAPYPWMKNIAGMQLVEPYKTSNLKLQGSYVDSGNYLFNWIIDDYDTTSWYTSFTTQQAVFTTTQTYNVKIQVILATTLEVVAEYETAFVCKYVKREIRNLTEDDRERFLDGMVQIWTYSQEEGVAKFGERFTSADALVAAHSLASNDMMCDQYHEGTGFLTHHLALALVFEESLRQIDPSLTVPYYDFTIEGETISRAKGKPSDFLNISPIFTDTWFGSVDENNHIQDSRWAHITMPKQTDGTSSVRNSYGYIRSYWNNNPDSEVSRKLFYTCGVEPEHKKIPTCEYHYDVLNSATFGEFQVTSPGDGHGPMHVQIGGMWGGCEQAYANFTSKWADLLNADMTDEEILAVGYKKWKWGNTAPRALMINTAIMGEYFHIYRSLWRSHMCAVDGTPTLLECPESCDEDLPFEECKCQVTKLVTGETTWENLFPCVLNTEENRQFFKSTMPDEMLSDLTYMLATASVQEGEMIESASPGDPMFWIIHPAIERLLQAKRLPAVTNMGGTDFYKWPVVDGSNETWLEYSYYSFEAGTNQFYPDAYECYGHKADDVVLKDMLPMLPAAEAYADINGDGIVTNWEFYLTLDPNVMEANDYVFDNFNWDHCASSESVVATTKPTHKEKA